MTAMIMTMLVLPSQRMKQATSIGSQRDTERNREAMVDNQRKPNIIQEMHSRIINLHLHHLILIFQITHNNNNAWQWYLESMRQISMLVSDIRMLQVQQQLLEAEALSCRVSHGELGSKNKAEVSFQLRMRPNNQRSQVTGRAQEHQST